MPESIKVSATFPVAPKDLYEAWLNGKKHSAFTGSKATVTPKVGGKFTAWDGYISGKTLELEPYARILQSWRSTEFSPENPDSILEILFAPDKKGTKLTLIHSNIPKSQGKQYKQGWLDFYFKPMQEYFQKKA